MEGGCQRGKPQCHQVDRQSSKPQGWERAGLQWDGLA